MGFSPLKGNWNSPQLFIDKKRTSLQKREIENMKLLKIWRDVIGKNAHETTKIG